VVRAAVPASASAAAAAAAAAPVLAADRAIELRCAAKRDCMACAEDYRCAWCEGAAAGFPTAGFPRCFPDPSSAAFAAASATAAAAAGGAPGSKVCGRWNLNCAAGGGADAASAAVQQASAEVSTEASAAASSVRHSLKDFAGMLGGTGHADADANAGAGGAGALPMAPKLILGSGVLAVLMLGVACVMGVKPGQAADDRG
jgi:hypothetical protein